MSDFGMWINDNYGRVLSQPAFTPMVLSGVIDLGGYTAPLTPPNPAQINTGVPVSRKCAVFFRGTDERQSAVAGNNFCCFRLINVGGFWVISFQTRPNPIRLYVFSNVMTKIPDYGIYFYANGEIIYHQNCLPLVVKTFDRRVPVASNPTRGKKCAAYPAILDTEYEEADVWGGQSLGVRQWFAGAGMINWTGTQYGWGVHYLDAGWYDANRGFQPRYRSFTVNILAYIETDIYDTYYKQALGLA